MCSGGEMNYKLVDFGRRAKEIRISMSLTQSDVRELVGLNEDTLRRTEKGITMPNIETLDLLSVAYQCDMNSIFSKYKITFDLYFEDRLHILMPDIRKLNYGVIDKEAKKFAKEFKEVKKINQTLIKFKMMQYCEYLKSLSNFEKAFADKSRNDITNLVIVTKYSLLELKTKSKSVKLDKLEIRIFVLISIIYRYKDEFSNSIVYLEAALSALQSRYKDDNDFLYFYFLIVLNLLTHYHRIDDYQSLDLLYKESLKVLEKKIGIPTLASYLIRVGVNKHYLNEDESVSLVDTGLTFLKDIGYETKSERFRVSLTERYMFLERLKPTK